MNEQRTDRDTRERVDGLIVFVKRQVTWQWAVIGTIFLITVAVAGAVGYTISQQNREREERVDQSCTISERKQRTDVDSLRRTYDYLLGLSPRERKSSFNQLVIANLPRVEAEAREDDAPEYCDEDGVGLKEPDPQIPPRPAGLGS